MPQRSSVLARKIGAFVQLSETELEYLSGLHSAPVEVKRGAEIVHEGQTGQMAYIIQSGWACSFKLLPDGGRQIITFPIPGDCVGLRSMLLRTSDHSFSALTDATVFRVEAARMRRLFIEVPHLGAAILWAASRDEAMVVEHLVSVGRRTPAGRTAHFLLELYDRLHLVGLAADNEFACPLNQYVLSDALGLSTIHVNRVLRELREKGLVTFKAHKVVIHDAARLKALAGYENPDVGQVVIGENRPQEGRA
jgi:CRP-like cAMP-binding protein